MRAVAGSARQPTLPRWTVSPLPTPARSWRSWSSRSHRSTSPAAPTPAAGGRRNQWQPYEKARGANCGAQSEALPRLHRGQQPLAGGQGRRAGYNTQLRRWQPSQCRRHQHTWKRGSPGCTPSAAAATSAVSIVRLKGEARTSSESGSKSASCSFSCRPAASAQAAGEHGANARCHTHPRAQDRRHHAQGQQPIGVAERGRHRRKAGGGSGG